MFKTRSVAFLTTIVLASIFAAGGCDMPLDEGDDWPAGPDAGPGGKADRVGGERVAIEMRPTPRRDSTEANEAGFGEGEWDANLRGFVPPRGQVWLFTDKNYSGDKMTIHTTDLSDIGGLLDPKYANTISSFKIGPDTRVTLYHDKNFGGPHQSFDCSKPDLSVYGYSDNVDSIKTAPELGWVWLFNNFHFTGKVSIRSKDWKKLDGDHIHKVYSLKAGAGTVAKIWDNYSYFGDYQLFEGHHDWILTKTFRAVSLQILPEKGFAWMYEETAYGGMWLVMNYGITYLGAIASGWDDRIESFKVGPETTLMLFEHPNFGGWKYEKNTNVKYMPVAYRNKASSNYVTENP